MLNMRKSIKTWLAMTGALLVSSAYSAGFNSGSTGADGAFSPTASTAIQVPASGVFNFSTITIPAGVTVTFVRNQANTPVVMLASGSVSIAGVIDVSGKPSPSVIFGQAGDLSAGGEGGPGGFSGGRGGLAESARRGGAGLGPGGGASGDGLTSGQVHQGGGGAGYGTAGTNGSPGGSSGIGGSTYGSNFVIPLVGGSGGGGGSGALQGDGTPGSGGGGGGGAILISSSTSITVAISGRIFAKGGNAGSVGGNYSVVQQYSSGGGGGSGGAIRLVAPSIVLDQGALLDVAGGGAGNGPGASGGNGGKGRVSVETVTAGSLNLAGAPSITITSVGGVNAPAIPTGSGDVLLAADAPNPATVALSTTGVPAGSTINLRLIPQRGAVVTATSTPVAGTSLSGTASASINIPNGTSNLIASTSFTLTVALGQALSQFAENEQVEKVMLMADSEGRSQTKLITVSGREVTASREAVQLLALARVY